MTENSLIALGCDFWVTDYVSYPGLNICVPVSLLASFTDYCLKCITSPDKFLGPHQQKVVPSRPHKRAFHTSSNIPKTSYQ